MTSAVHVMAFIERNERIRLQNSQLINDESVLRSVNKLQSLCFDNQHQHKPAITGVLAMPPVVSQSAYSHHHQALTRQQQQPLQQSLVAIPTVIDSTQVRSALAMLAASSSPLSSPDAPSAASLSPTSSSLTDGALAAVTVVAQPTASSNRSRRPLDRSASEPMPSAAAAVLLEQSGGGMGPGSAVAFCRYKTELCRPFEENGTCKYADKCQFAHGRAELRPIVRHPKYKTDLCRTYHTTGLCPYGPRCHFIHNDEERRLNDVNRMVIEQQQQQQQQRAVLLQAAAQQEMLTTAALLSQRRLEAVAAAVQTSSSAPHHVAQAIASSLQRSLSLGSSRTSVGNSTATRTGGVTASPRLRAGAVPLSSGCGRGSVDSVMSMGSSPSPTSSATSNATSSSSSDLDSPPFQRVPGDRRQSQQQRSDRLASPSSSPEHFSFPVNVAENAGSIPTASPRQSTSVARPQQASSDTTIMLALLARRMRDAELQQHQQLGRDEEAKAKILLAKLLQSATVPTTQIDVTAALESVAYGGRCGGRRATTDQRWASFHGTTAGGYGDTARLCTN